MTRTSIRRAPIGLCALLALAGCPAPVSSEDSNIFADGQDQCQHEVCGFDEFDTTASMTTRDIGTCLQRPVSDGGQGTAAQSAMEQVYDAVRSGGVTVGHSFVEYDSPDELAVGRGSAFLDPDVAIPETALLDAINAAAAGASVPNSEGLYYCLRDAGTGADAFYWVLNCAVLREDRGGSGDYALCDGLTPVEKTISGDLDAVAYVVDATLFGDDTWRRFVFNDQVAALTDVQPIEGGGFKCNERPWFTTNFCSDPMATTCPTDFVKTNGRGAFQTYGEVGVAVVGQDVREYHLKACLELEPRNTDGGINVVAIAVSVAVVVLLLLIIAFLAYRLRKLKAHTKELEARGEVVPPISAKLKMSSIVVPPPEVVEKARSSAKEATAEAHTSDEESS